MRVVLLTTAVFLLFGCIGEESGSNSPNSKLRIAEQHGLAYLPLAIMQVTGILDEELARVSAGEAEWIRTGNATMIREAMLSGRLDIGFMGIPPFLIGVDRDTGWQLITGLSEAPLGLVTTRPNYENLSDISPQDRIALPQPGSIQHILLAMAAERTFDEPQRFDDQLVSMGHPEGLTALLSGRDVTAQFTSPPYLFQALDHPEATLLLNGEEAFGGRFTFIVGVTAPGWVEKTENSETREAFFRALDRATDSAQSLQDTLHQDPEASSELLRELSEFYDVTEANLREHLSYPGMVYTREIFGVDQFVERMDRYGYIDAADLPPYRSSTLE